MLPHWRRLIWQGLHSFIDPKTGTSVYCEHFSIIFLFIYLFIYFYFLFIYFFFFFCIFYMRSNWSQVIGHCMQIFNLVSIWMQIKLGILSIQTFVWQHEHAVSRFQIWWLSGFEAPGPSGAQAISAYSALIQNMTMKFTKKSMNQENVSVCWHLDVLWVMAGSSHKDFECITSGYALRDYQVWILFKRSYVEISR